MDDQADERPSPGEAPDPGRRKLLSCALKASVATFTAGLGGPSLIYLWPLHSEGPGSESVKAGPVKDLAVGKSMLVKVAGSPLLVVRLAEDKYRAFSAICTHLGCLVDFRKDKEDIFCPCHGGRFDLEGKVVGGPPPSPLPQYPVTVSEGEIQVRLRKV